MSTASAAAFPERWGFAGHETFAFRYGWLTKAVEAVRQSPSALSREQAVVALGVGKNMIESIRHWGLATQVLIETGRSGLAVSEIGSALLEQWDPFLEHPASIWLLHWLLVTNPGEAAVWYLAFNHYPQPDFTKQGLMQWIQKFVERRSIAVRPATLSRDVDCFVRSYVASLSGARAASEDSFDCPLSDLLLINGQRDGETYRFTIGSKRTLPVEVFGYALLQFAIRTARGRSSLSIADCVYGAGSPGQVFKLDENSFVDYVERITGMTNGRVQFDDTSGLRQVYLDGALQPAKLLSQHYQTKVES